MKNYLVRVTTGKYNIEELKAHNTYTRKLYDLLEETNEVLLWRQVRRTGAKALHIFKNSNNNNKRSATVYFENEEDCINSAKFTIHYFNTRLNWANKEYKVSESNTLETERIRIPYSKEYKRKSNNSSWRESPLSIESSDDKASVSENSAKEKQQRSAYSKKKSKEIREGKRKEAFNEASSSTSTSRKLSVSYENSINYMLQLIRGLEEKIQHMEWEAPNRS